MSVQMYVFSGFVGVQISKVSQFIELSNNIGSMYVFKK